MPPNLHKRHAPAVPHRPAKSFRKSKSCWAQDRVTHVTQFPAGPSTLDELFDWPTSIAMSISMSNLGRKDVSDESAAMLQNVKRHMIDRIDVVTDYSGVECPR